MKNFALFSTIIFLLLFFNCNDPSSTGTPNNTPVAGIIDPQQDDVILCTGTDGVGHYATVNFTGTATDDEDEDNTLLVEWFSSTDGKLGEGRELTAQVHMLETCNQTITIILKVTDSGSRSTEVSIQIYLYIVC